MLIWMSQAVNIMQVIPCYYITGFSSKLAFYCRGGNKRCIVSDMSFGKPTIIFSKAPSHSIKIII